LQAGDAIPRAGGSNSAYVGIRWRRAASRTRRSSASRFRRSHPAYVPG